MQRVQTALGVMALAFSAAACIVVVDDEPPVECGQHAYVSGGGECVCDLGYDGDAYDGCDPIQTWLVTDSCNDGIDVAWALYSLDRDWSWPAPPDAFLTPGLNYDQYEDITCIEGELICFGATAGDISWGVGLDGEQPCDDCCFFCDVTLVDVGYLTCS